MPGIDKDKLTQPGKDMDDPPSHIIVICRNQVWEALWGTLIVRLFIYWFIYYLFGANWNKVSQPDNDMDDSPPCVIVIYKN